MEAPSGTILVWSDIGCPWAHALVYRLHEARTRLELEDAVSIEHLSYPLELFNEQPTPKNVLDAEIPVVGAIAPGAGWQVWNEPEWHWPVTTLPALEAVRAARLQSAGAAERLDRALRVALFSHAQCISMRHVILEVARNCEGVDAKHLAQMLDEGRARRRVIEEWRRARAGDVKGSPHLFLHDGTDAHNPGVEMHWEGKPGTGFPVIDRDCPEVIDELLIKAADAAE
jgi:predicted DsbA family dithiol-disulfide isomerase